MGYDAWDSLCFCSLSSHSHVCLEKIESNVGKYLVCNFVEEIMSYSWFVLIFSTMHVLHKAKVLYEASSSM